MDPELLETLRDCAVVTNRLLDLLKRDEEDMPGCVSGQLLAECQRGTAEAQRVAGEIRTGLLQLMILE